MQDGGCTGIHVDFDALTLYILYKCILTLYYYIT